MDKNLAFMKKVYFVFTFLFLLLFKINAQKTDTLYFMQQYRLGEKLMVENKPDSAILVFNTLNIWRVKNKNFDSSVYVTSYLSYLGRCYRIVEKPQLSHEFLMQAITNARKYKHTNEYRITYARLNLLHKVIAEKKLKFNYPVVNETETNEVYFPIKSVLPYGKDSLEVIVHAGKLDGILNDSQYCRISSRLIEGDTLFHQQVSTTVSVPIYSLDDNTLVLHISNTYKEIVIAKDFVVCLAETPISWNKLKLKKLLLLHDIFRNFKDGTDDYYSYRFFYYYGNPQVDEETMFCMLNDAKNAAYAIAKDTLTNATFATKYYGGIFSGQNMFNAIILSQPIHQQLFFEYEASAPANNIGNYPSFSYEYANWVATGSTLNPASIYNYLISLTDEKYKIEQIKNLFDQIKKNDLVEQWFATAMQDLNEENYESAIKTTQLLKQVVYENKDTANYGWPEFLFANIKRRNGDATIAMKYLQDAKNYFNVTNNYEGKTLIAGIEDSWQTPKSLNISMQNGHTMPFITALSPNGKYFATGSMDNQIKIWNKVKGKEIKTIGYHLNTITALSYSPNGRYLISASEDKQLQIWDTYNYTAVAGFKFEGVVNVAKFSPNSKLLYLVEDSILYIINPFAETFTLVKKITLHSNMVNDIIFYKNNPNIIYTVSDDSTMCKWDIKNEKKSNTYSFNAPVKSISISNNNRYIVTITSNKTLHVLDLYLNEYILNQKIFLEATYYSSPCSSLYAAMSFSPDSKFLAYPIARDSFRIYNIADGYSRKYKAEIGSYYLRSTLYTNDGKDLLLVNNGYNFKMMNTANYNFETNASLTSNEISFYANQLSRIQYSQDDNTIHFIQYGPNYGKIDLSTGKSNTKTSSEIYFPKGKIINFNQNDFFPLKTAKTSNVMAIYSLKQDAIVDSIFFKENENIESFAVTPNNKTYFISSENGRIFAWDAEKKKIKFDTYIATDESKSSMMLYYDNYKNRLFTKATTNYVLVLNAENGKVTDTVFTNAVRFIAIAKNKIFMSTGAGKFDVIDAVSLKSISLWSINSTNTEAYDMAIINNEKNVIVQNTLNSFKVYDVALDTFVYSSGNMQVTSNDIALSNNGKEFALACNDGTIRLFDIANYHQKATIFLPFKRDAFIVDSNNHYLVTKNSLNALNVNFNDNVYPYDQFDLQLNRPDLVLKSLGRADSAILKSYQLAYAKRLKITGAKEVKNNITTLHLPTIKLIDKFTIQSSTSNNYYKVNVECSDTKYKLQELQVMVNNSPVLGVNGKNLSKLNSNKYQQEISIPLAYGTNKIKIYCTNENGISSLKETFTVLSTYNDTAHKPTLYFVGIGVANYKDKNYNLTYSAKDIRDLVHDVSSNYNKVIIDTLINENVTIENIIKLKKLLQQTTPDDRVVVAVTGHGLLSDSLDFYYATYDVNFTQPQIRGLKYEALEALLNDVPAQEKIMFIDACHSGALDKDELLAIQKNKEITISNKNKEQKNVKGIASRSSIIIKNKSSKIKPNSSFDLMQNTFSNIGNSNGAIIVSAAGGMEYAFESPEWSNGVFTFAIREGWFKKYADKIGSVGNNDDMVSVYELIDYISNRVTELTNGKQKPNSRKDNLEFNWVIKY